MTTIRNYNIIIIRIYKYIIILTDSMGFSFFFLEYLNSKCD